MENNFIASLQELAREKDTSTTLPQGETLEKRINLGWNDIVQAVLPSKIQKEKSEKVKDDATSSSN